MKIKTSELTGAALDWAVGQADGIKLTWYDDRFVANFDSDRRGGGPWFKKYEPSSDWSQGGPIGERERLHACPITYHDKPEWESWPDGKRHLSMFGLTELTAKMRCFVASKLGDEIDVPEELLA